MPSVWEETMKLIPSLVAGGALTVTLTTGAVAQNAVRPQWNYQGSAVCPEGYDYIQGLCRARGGYGGGYGRPSYDGPRYRGGGYGGDGVEPRWNRRGSAVCPEGYDFHA